MKTKNKELTGEIIKVCLGYKGYKKCNCNLCKVYDEVYERGKDSEQERILEIIGFCKADFLLV